MLNRLHVLFIFLVSAVVFVGFTLPVYAAPSPDVISIEYGKVFQNIFEDGDQLYICRYKLNYATEPGDDASDLFIFAITSGDTVLRDRPLLSGGYGDDVIAIYLAGDDTLEWGTDWIERSQRQGKVQI
jgi:hypothetical protein